MSTSTSVAIIGAGPAGLTTAFTLGKRGVPSVVFEADTRVGGISRTVEHEGFRFDIGGHRFYSRSDVINALWDEMLPEGFLTVPRKSRIYYDNKFFSYPLKPIEALRKLSVVEAVTCVASYIRAQMKPYPAPAVFDEWVINRFGRRLFEIFFQTYTEKVWGMPCHEISSDWAAQRIGTLSLWSALSHAFLPDGMEGRAKTLIQTFRYPRFGPGMLWESCARQVEAGGAEVRLRSRVVSCQWQNDRWTIESEDADGRRTQLTARHLVSSAPLSQFVKMLVDVGPAVRAAAGGLKYRDFLTVCLMFDQPATFDDQWIYIHDPQVQVGRVQNFGAWSADMLSRPGTGCLGLEYFCHEEDGLWTKPDAALIDQATRELRQIGLWTGAAPVGACVLRQPKAYPVYDVGYAQRVETILRGIEARFPTLQFVGRNGLHRYNNQDHAMMTGLLAAENILLGRKAYDPARVNGDAEYIEDDAPLAPGSALRDVPVRASVRVNET